MDDRLPTAPGSFRIGDAERAAACDQLGVHFAAGRLSADELDVRLAGAVSARNQQDLGTLFVDLAAITPTPVGPVPSGQAGGRPSPRSFWTVPTVLVLLLLVSSALTAGVLLLILGSVDFGLFVAAGFGGTAAAVGGACGAHLTRRWQDRSGSGRPI